MKHKKTTKAKYIAQATRPLLRRNVQSKYKRNEGTDGTDGRNKTKETANPFLAQKAGPSGESKTLTSTGGIVEVEPYVPVTTTSWTIGTTTVTTKSTTTTTASDMMLTGMPRAPGWVMSNTLRRFQTEFPINFASGIIPTRIATEETGWSSTTNFAVKREDKNKRRNEVQVRTEADSGSSRKERTNTESEESSHGHDDKSKRSETRTTRPGGTGEVILSMYE